jgi:hypothetical protein
MNGRALTGIKDEGGAVVLQAARHLALGKSRGCAVFEKASAGTPKLAARISGGVWATQSVRSSVLNSLALPSSKQMMNSHPSVPAPAMNAAGGQKGSTSRRDDHEPQGS